MKKVHLGITSGVLLFFLVGKINDDGSVLGGTAYWWNGAGGGRIVLSSWKFEFRVPVSYSNRGAKCNWLYILKNNFG